MPDVAGDPRRIDCPACFAPAGQPCTRPTNDSRVPVNWHHISRESRAGLPAPAYRPPRLPEHLRIETVDDLLRQKGER